ncbi:isocitrate lyase/PEP mutase family protein [Kiloniella sp.]|uniref:isocitrate lyase/PEP mutase family protein n=1 Tax=Kiloniella sp. TaxID=1938587 RepID=UPI003B02BED5
MNSQTKSEIFRDLHSKDGLFVLANVWDVGSAKMMAAMGFPALATTSAGYAFSQGKIDWVGALSREEVLDHAGELLNATDLPVSADLEDGYGATPEEVAKTVTLAGEIGLAGCTIEDTTGNKESPIYDFGLAKERIAAAVEAANALSHPFMLTARAENYLHGRPDLDDTIKRLQAFDEVGADVLYAPGLPDLDAVRTVCRATDKPINVVAGIGLPGVSIEDLRDAGVKRVSLGSVLARTAIGAALNAASDILEKGILNDAFGAAATFSHIEDLISAASNKA